MKRALLLFLIICAGCTSSPPPAPPAPKIRAPADARTAPADARPQPGSRAAAIYGWKESFATELPSHDPKKPWKLVSGDYVKTQAGLDAWNLEYQLDGDKLSVGVVEYPSDASAREALAAAFAGRGVTRPIDVSGAVAGGIEGSDREDQEVGVPRRVDGVVGLAVERHLFLFDRRAEGAAAPAKLEDAPVIDGSTVRAFVNAVMPGKLGG